MNLLYFYLFIIVIIIIITLIIIIKIIISSPEPKAQGDLIVYRTSCRLSVCLSVCLWTFSNSNISATSGPIVTIFLLNNHWGEGKAALGFRPDRIRTLVSMATDRSHRIIMGKML